MFAVGFNAAQPPICSIQVSLGSMTQTLRMGEKVILSTQGVWEEELLRIHVFIAESKAPLRALHEFKQWIDMASQGKIFTEINLVPDIPSVPNDSMFPSSQYDVG